MSPPPTPHPPKLFHHQTYAMSSYMFIFSSPVLMLNLSFLFVFPPLVSSSLIYQILPQPPVTHTRKENYKVHCDPLSGLSLVLEIGDSTTAVTVCQYNETKQPPSAMQQVFPTTTLGFFCSMGAKKHWRCTKCPQSPSYCSCDWATSQNFCTSLAPFLYRSA